MKEVATPTHIYTYPSTLGCANYASRSSGSGSRRRRKETTRRPKVAYFAMRGFCVGLPQNSLSRTSNRHVTQPLDARWTEFLLRSGYQTAFHSPRLIPNRRCHLASVPIRHYTCPAQLRAKWYRQKQGQSKLSTRKRRHHPHSSISSAPGAAEEASCSSHSRSTSCATNSSYASSEP